MESRLQPANASNFGMRHIFYFFAQLETFPAEAGTPYLLGLRISFSRAGLMLREVRHDFRPAPPAIGSSVRHCFCRPNG